MTLKGPTRWGNQLNGNPTRIPSLSAKDTNASGPHSLGQSVEWKLLSVIRIIYRSRGPTRWGNQLNGNLSRYCRYSVTILGPTRWGNQLNGNFVFAECPQLATTKARPHSLGQSVEWKPSIANATWLSVKGPHSLGQSVEWKQ